MGTRTGPSFSEACVCLSDEAGYALLSAEVLNHIRKEKDTYAMPKLFIPGVDKRSGAGSGENYYLPFI